MVISVVAGGITPLTSTSWFNCFPVVDLYVCTTLEEIILSLSRVNFGCADFGVSVVVQVVYHSELRGVRVLRHRCHCGMRRFDRKAGSSQLRRNRIPHVSRRLCK